MQSNIVTRRNFLLLGTYANLIERLLHGNTDNENIIPASSQEKCVPANFNFPSFVFYFFEISN